MDEERAYELHSEVVPELTDLINDRSYDRVIVNMGSEYRRVISGLDGHVGAEIHRIEGEGIGVKGSRLKRFIRAENVVGEVID